MSVKELKLRRDGLHKQMESLIRFLTPLSSAIVPSKMDDIYNQFLKLQNEIQTKGDAEEIEENNEALESFLQLYFDAISSNSIKEENQEKPIIKSDNIKLPTIELPKFSGSSFEGWLEFKEIFESLIHKSDTIDTIQKFHYLRACLTGKAAELTKSISFTASNYMIAWDVLCTRYDNSRLLVHHHVKSLFDMKNVKYVSSVQIRDMFDNIRKHLQTLRLLKEPVDSWDTLLIFMFSAKLPEELSREWEEESFGRTGKPTFEEFLFFLKTKADIQETLEQKGARRKTTTNLLVEEKRQCNFCGYNHTIYNCKKFLELAIPERKTAVSQRNLCYNCLRTGHFYKNCTFSPCRTCGLTHNTLLHENQREKQAQTPSMSSSIALTSRKVEEQFLLSTVLLRLSSSTGKHLICRAILDSGSQSNFIKRTCAEKLDLQLFDNEISIQGISAINSQVQQSCEVKISALRGDFEADLQFLVLDEICAPIPSHDFRISNWTLPRGLPLADPQFNHSNEIDLLLGAGIFWKIIRSGQKTLNNNKCILQNTAFGWIVSCPVPMVTSTICNVSTTTKIHEQLKKFWELENITEEEIRQENEDIELFEARKHENGQFIVKIPLRCNENVLGDSREYAMKRFMDLEKRFTKNIHLKEQYSNFIREYIEMGHMSEVESDAANTTRYYFPHHAVYKNINETPKIRVVFDGSAITTSGYSFNDIQFTGPNIQNDLLSMMLRFRSYKYVVSADIEKMYRQILIEENQRPLQRILWRFDNQESIKTYELNTVTYGTASAPYLALSCLKRLAENYEMSNPEASEVIRRDFYMDDLLTGSDNLNHLQLICKEVSDILASAKFPLRKWVSNNEDILQNLGNKYQEEEGKMLLLNSEKTKTLGLYWTPKTDVLTFSVKHKVVTPTKRNILSQIAKIYDPLGLVCPVTVSAKILLQDIWKLNISWDEILPPHICSKWKNFENQLNHLNNVNLNRNVFVSNAKEIELHGFCDASQEAYGACIYIRCVDENNISSNLLCAKTKVAPLKGLTTPRLELCGALLLAQLVTKIYEALSVNPACYLWCDSQVVLAWIQTDPIRLNVFVANRVKKIQALTRISDWNFISTKENPADILSRGCSASNIINNNLWWKGPEWLNVEQLPSEEYSVPEKIPELKMKITSLVTSKRNKFPFENFSNFNKMVRVVSLILRAIHNFKNKNNKRTGTITVEERQVALQKLIMICQEDSFSELKTALKGAAPIKTSMQSLSPFLDDNNIIRVGGRLQNSNFPYEKKHPILLPSDHRFTKILFQTEHLRLLHAGPQLLLSTIRNNFWPIRGRGVARQVVHECNRCFRCKPRHNQPAMGNLPAERLSPTYPFNNTGVDYAGPFQIKEKRGRGSKYIKGYICIFVCFIIKAVHLELVTDLSTESFMAALRRFISRRGKPSNIFSDNGTNFVGAKSEIIELYNFIKTNNDTIENELANEEIKWHFIPPNAPNFGGLWEAGVKSVKHHLKRVLFINNLIYEEFYTILVQIESVLNSRPLSPMSSDPNDLNPLTPGHFLIGRAITSLPDHDLKDVKQGRLSRYQLVQQICQHFWVRWYKEYISQLQQRHKWAVSSKTTYLDTLVLIKDDNLPPMRWKLGRVTEVHPGSDGVIRVASVKTTSGVVKRPVSKLCPLPLQ